MLFINDCADVLCACVYVCVRECVCMRACETIRSGIINNNTTNT